MIEAAGGKDLWMVGGGDLAAQFAEAGLLDEVVRARSRRSPSAPGAPLFPRRCDLRLVGARPQPRVLCARYAVVARCVYRPS